MKIENDLYLVEINSRNGVISRIFDKCGAIDLISEPRLADNFKLTIPLPADDNDNNHAFEGNYILGKEQKLSSVKKTGNGLILYWDGPLKNSSGELFDVDVVMGIDCVGKGIQFGLKIYNKTPFKIGEVWYPLLGGLAGFGDANQRKETQMTLPSGTGVAHMNIFHTFGAPMSLGGLTERFYAYPNPQFYYFGFFNFRPIVGGLSMPWADFWNNNVNRGMYFGSQERSCRFKVLNIQMYPGGNNSDDRWKAPGRMDGDWPKPEEIQGLPIGIILSWVHFPYSKPGSVFEGSQIVLQFHEGNWLQADKIYNEWFESAFKKTDYNETCKKLIPAVQNIKCLSSKNIVRFKDIPKIARDNLDSGVKNILINDWWSGGEESHTPLFEPDPSLGTWDDLESAISKCHNMGVMVVVSIKIQPVDNSSDWYKKELYKYVCMDCWGTEYSYYEQKENDESIASRMKWIYGSSMVNLDLGFPAFRKIIVSQVKKIAEIGADGTYIRDMTTGVIVQNFVGTSVDFNPKLKLGPDQAIWEGALLCLEEIAKECKKINPEFYLITDYFWDRAVFKCDLVLHIKEGDTFSSFKIPAAGRVLVDNDSQ